MHSDGGYTVIEAACEALGKNHQKHIKGYGAHDAERLTGRQETCAIDEFRYGVSDRGASIRIPMATANRRSPPRRQHGPLRRHPPHARDLRARTRSDRAVEVIA